MGALPTYEKIEYLDETIFPAKSSRRTHEFPMVIQYILRLEQIYKKQFYTLILCMEHTNIFSKEITFVISNYFKTQCIFNIKYLYQQICTDQIFRYRGQLAYSLIDRYVRNYENGDDLSSSLTKNKQLYDELKGMRATHIKIWTKTRPRCFKPVDSKPFISNHVYKRKNRDKRHLKAIIDNNKR